ncbi:MAG: FAD-dependent tricarballylate dehydrogenase TcuA [Beijerinckiaceae bacterium]
MNLPLFCDVLVVGGGTAALCAAVSARQAGAAVLLAERAPKELRGGNTRHSRNCRIMHQEPSPLFPASYSEDEFWSDLEHVAGGAVDEALARLLIRRSADIPEWLAANGVAFQTIADGSLPWSRKTAFFLGGGKAMVNALYATACRAGVAILYDSAVSALDLDGSATLSRDGVTKTVRTRATVVCSGGYQANKAWLRRAWGEAADNFVNRGTPFATGDALQSLLDLGAAAAGSPGACHLVAVDARSPEHDGGIVTRVKAIPFGIVVDRHGRRFHDEEAEAGPKHYSAWGRLVASCPGQSATLILDAKGIERMPPSVFPPIQGQTIAEIAAALNIDLDGLTATVEECGKLKAPPFSAFPIRPGVTFTCHGVKVDQRARVLMSDGHPCKNLFAAGMIMAPNILGTGYLAGAAITIGVVFGRIAGEEAARYALS